MDSVSGIDLLTGAGALLKDWRGAPAAVLLKMFIALPAGQQGSTEEEQAGNQRNARALLAYIEGGDFDRAYQLHQRQQEALKQAVQLVAEERQEKRQKVQARQQRKKWLRDEVAALSRSGATRREMQALLQVTGWEIGAAVGWNKRNGVDLLPQRPNGAAVVTTR
ncbi:hypothetical protein [Citrobacter portucalensis]|uniref:hypothetical protein n=1 Tax=Citrobacter portucalensis TaxID=1639133 RepID=UPI0030D3BA53|nr:hypothetical protein [Citrobacter freundii]